MVLERQLYQYNGYTTPGTLIYSEFSFVNPTTRLTLDYSPATGDFPPAGIATGVTIPTTRTLTWTLQFSGLGAGESAGVDLYSGAPAGSMYTAYWQNLGTVGSPNWELLQDAGKPITIGQEWMGTAVPEPRTGLISDGRSRPPDGRPPLPHPVTGPQTQPFSKARVSTRAFFCV